MKGRPGSSDPAPSISADNPSARHILRMAAGRVVRARYLNVVLAAQAEASDQRLVTSCTRPLEVVQQPPPLADHNQQPAARVEVFFVGRKMASQVANTLAQDRHLHLG